MTPAEVRKKWVEALRSGKYQQSRGRLKSPQGYCCLGVLCELAVESGIIGPAKVDSHGLAYNGYTHFVPPEVKAWSGLKHRCGSITSDERKDTALWMLNDAGASFESIAATIESNDEYFQNIGETND